LFYICSNEGESVNANFVIRLAVAAIPLGVAIRQHGFAPCHDYEPRAIGHGALTNPWTVRASDRELLQQVADFSRQLAIAGQSEKEDDVA
jgi:hypothetical protein